MATHDARSIVVGVNGSESALNAAAWAATEAALHDVPLRIVYGFAESVLRVRPGCGERGPKAGYARSARSLSMGRTGAIGVIVPDIVNPFFPPVIKAIQARAATKDVSVLLADTDEHVADESERARALVRQVDGLVLVSPRTPEKDLPAILQLVPAVFVNRRVTGAPSVVVENSEGINQAVQHLHALGHRRICYLSGPRQSWSNEQRGRQ
ncbi:substrate-binding domain-containing protein [Actinopolymorpha singaporensis]